MKDTHRGLTTVLVFILIILGFSFVKSCNENNEFILGENVTVCLGEGSYENNSLFQSFDGGENCKLFVYYPNLTNLVNNSAMNFLSNRFQLNLGNISVGKYNAFSYCYKNQGYWEDWFNFDVYLENCSNSNIRLENGSCSNITNYPSLRSSIATGTIYQNGEKIKTMTACLDEKNLPISSLATVTIYYPNNTIWINNSNMTQMETGIYNYSNYAPNVKGIYLIKSTCQNGSDASVAVAEMQLPDWITTTSDYTAPTIISINPSNNTIQTGTSLVNFEVATNENSTCSINLNGTNYNLNTSNNLLHTYSPSLGNNFYQFNVTCNDTNSNTATSVNYFLTVSYNPGGGGTSINLENINITHEDWFIGEKNILFIETLDKYKNRTDVSNVSVMNNSFMYYQMQRLGVGYYQAIIKLNKSIENVTLRVVVDDKGKIQEKQIVIDLIEKPIISGFKNIISGYSIKMDSWISDNKMLFWMSILVLLVGLVLVSVIVHYLKK